MSHKLIHLQLQISFDDEGFSTYELSRQKSIFNVPIVVPFVHIFAFFEFDIWNDPYYRKLLIIFFFFSFRQFYWIHFSIISLDQWLFVFDILRCDQIERLLISLGIHLFSISKFVLFCCHTTWFWSIFINKNETQMVDFFEKWHRRAYMNNPFCQHVE